MKNKITRFINSLFLTVFSSAFAHSQFQDGPYVFYLHDTLAIRTVIDKDGKPAMSEQLIFNNKEKIHVNIPSSDTIGNGFGLDLAPLQNQPTTYPKPKKLLVLSDIEGEFANFKTLLLANGVIDGNYEWIFGDGHLVICGDMFDRGTHVTEYLWLLYKLEEDAKAKGGYVHVILGNHDIMNLSGDFRYVQPKYFETAKALGVEYRELFGKNTELGRWLRTKNIMEKIGDMLFLHAGISPEVTRLGLSAQLINDSSRMYYDIDIDSLPASIARFYGTDNSPFWYRGYFIAPRATESQVDSSLTLFDVKKIFVGHTVLKDILKLYGGKVIGLDVNQHEGNAQAILIEDDKIYRVGTKGERLDLKEASVKQQ